MPGLITAAIEEPAVPRNAAALCALKAIADSAIALCEISSSGSMVELKEALDRCIQEHGDLVSSRMPVIRHALQEQLEHGRSSPDIQIEQLFALVESMQKEVGELEAAEEARWQRTLLGHAAYRLDEVARDYVFRGEPQITLLSIGAIRKRAERGELSPGQAAHWEDFQRFLAARKWSASDVEAVAKQLRVGRFVGVGVRGSEAQQLEQQQVTELQLHEWACHHLRPDQVPGVKSFIRLIAEFAVEGQVLSTAGNAISVVDVCLEQLES